MGAALRAAFVIGRQVLIGLGIMQIGQNVSDLESEPVKKGIGILGWLVLLVVGVISFLSFKTLKKKPTKRRR